MSIWQVSIRESDRQLARVVRNSGWLWRPEGVQLTFDLWEELLTKAIARSGVRFIEGAISGSLGDRATAWGRRLVTLPDGFSERDRTRKLPTLTHELRHCDEYPYHTGFRLKYLASVRFRWAVECQSVFAELRCMKALGALPANLLRRAERAAESFAKPFPGYSMGRIRRLREETIALLSEVIP